MLIHNPTAGDERPTAADLKKILAEAGFQVRYQSSKGNWKRALQQEADVVIAAGGDGTVAQILLELAGTGRTVAVLPVGTANNISRTLRIVGDAREIVAGWRNARPRPFDVGIISTPDGEHRFVEAAGGGLFAAAIRDGEDNVEESGAFLGNETDRSLIHLRATIEQAEPRRWRVEIDGVDYSGMYLAVEAMNIRHAGASVPIAPNADPGDGLLDVVLIRKRARPGLIRYVEKRLEQQAVKLPKLKIRRGRRVELRVKDAPMRVDDQVVGHVRADWKLTLEPGSIMLLR